MSWKQTSERKETLLGGTDSGRITYPSIRGSNRRNDPDGLSTVPYFSGLLGTSITITIGGDVNATSVITFTTSSYADCLSTINAVSPANLKAEDDDGFLRVSNLNGGNKNYIRIDSGSAASILGFEINPIPGSISYAGELSTSPSGWPAQQNDQLTRLVAKNESFSSNTFNRSILSAMTSIDTILVNLDREICVPKILDVSIVGNTFTVPVGYMNDRLFTPGSTDVPITSSNPTTSILDKYIVLLDEHYNQVFVNDIRVRISYATYGPFVSTATPFTNWGTPDGKSIFGSSVWTKLKCSASIISLKGNVIYAPGAQFVTKKCMPNDSINISLATNLTPFSHNGDFIIDSVIDENHISVRPKGTNDTNYDTSYPPPIALNEHINGGEVYGVVSVYVGKFIPLWMPGAQVEFGLSASVPLANYKIVLPVARTLRSILSDDQTLSTIARAFGGQIELGSKLGALGKGTTSRIILPPNTNDPLTCIITSMNSSNRGSRVYTSNNGRYLITSNAKWNGAAFEKDVSGEEAFVIELNKDQVLFSSVLSSENLSWTSSHVVALFKNNDQTISSLSETGNGLYLGTEISSNSTKALVPRIQYGVYSLSPTYTLLSKVNDDLPYNREYHLPGGSHVRTNNAEWTGTDWLKDQPGTSTKMVMNHRGIAEFVHSDPTMAIINFSDTDWQTRDIVKDYQLNENFEEDYTLTPATGNITTRFKVSTITDAKHLIGSDFTPGSSVITEGIYGIFGVNVPIPASYELRADGRIGFGVRNRDFILKIKLITPDISVLDSSASIDDPGVFVGMSNFSDMPPPSNVEQIGVISGVGDTNWKVRVDNTDILTGVPNSQDWTTFIFERISDLVYIYINNVLVTTASYVDAGFLRGLISTKGTTLMANKNVLGVDYIKFWLADY